MAQGAARWIWENSRASNGSLIVLLAIADEIGEGESTEMKIADLAVKCRLSDKGTRNAVRDLMALGELSVEGGQGAVARFAVRATSVKTTEVHRQKLPKLPPASVKTTEVELRQKLPKLPEEPQVKATSVKSAEVEIPDALDLGSVVSGGKSKSRAVSGAPRPDVDRLCEHLADRIEANGCKRPNITDRWRTAARLMIDSDGRTEKEIHGAIDWSQQHHFWHRNILSMEKLRAQYDRLLLDAKAERTRPGPQSGGNSNLDVVARFMQRARNGNS